jgi:outer membrane receptor protein involved in Fe transport
VRSRGVELEATLRPVDWLNFTNTVIYNEATYGEATEPAAVRGRQIVNAPEWTWQSQLFVERPIGSTGWTTQWAANLRLLSDINTSVGLIPQAEQDGYVLLGGRIGVRSPGGTWDVSAFAQNLTNQYFRTIVFAGVLQPGTFNAYVGEPRSFGIEARMRF